MKRLDFENIKLMPGILELLKVIKKHKIKTAIASSSSKEYIISILKLINLLGFFDVIVSADMVNKPKPSPDIFLLAAKKLREKIEDCIAIEESSSGIIAARSAGMKTIAIASSLKKSSSVKQIWLLIG